MVHNNIIVPIHKAGDPLDPNSYGIIMIGHILAKIYGLVLEVVVSTFPEDHGPTVTGQANF